MKLLSRGNPKTVKGEKKGFLTHILHLAPSILSGYQVCPMASKGCAAACLNTAGRGRFDKIQNARIRKTRMFFENRDTFMSLLVNDIKAGIRKAGREGLIPVFRLNGTSDLRWETVKVNHKDVTYDNIFQLFHDVQFYDYTKLPNRKNLPGNYHLTFSRSEENDNVLATAWKNGMNLAVVFDTPKGKPLPERYSPTSRSTENLLGILVVDGDETDLRFMDPEGVVVGLRAKGAGKKDTSGFVVKAE